MCVKEGARNVLRDSLAEAWVGSLEECECVVLAVSAIDMYIF